MAPINSFDSIYYDHDPPEALAPAPHQARRALALGCARGRLAEALKRRQVCHVAGIEWSKSAAEYAQHRLDRLIVADCETLDLDANFQPAEFDCLIAADILEHLRDPEDLLVRLRRFMASDARIVVSLPNVRHAGVLESAARGFWTYQDWGILDRTHLRFFTRREIEAMFERLGCQIDVRETVDDPGIADWERLGRPLLP